MLSGSRLRPDRPFVACFFLLRLAEHASDSHQEGRYACGYEYETPFAEADGYGFEYRLQSFNVQHADHQQQGRNDSKHQIFVLKRIAVEDRAGAPAVENVDELGHNKRRKRDRLCLDQLIRMALTFY